MNINLTLFGEAITFAILVWVTMKFIWPPISKAMQEREQKIADGLAAADKGKKSLELAEKRIKEQLRATKTQAADIIDQTNQRGAQVVEDAKTAANTEGKKILELAKADIATETEKAQQQLRQQTANLVVAATEKILQRELNAKTNQSLIDKVITEI